MNLYPISTVVSNCLAGENNLNMFTFNSKILKFFSIPNWYAPGCSDNYTPEDRVQVFKLPDGPPELRHAWIRALHRDDISDLKIVYVCVLSIFQRKIFNIFTRYPEEMAHPMRSLEEDPN